MSSNAVLWEGVQCSVDWDHGEPDYYCMQCDMMFCNECWFKIKSHRISERGHDQIRPSDAIIVHSTLKVRLDALPLLENAIKQFRAKVLYQVDDNSEWFGVRRKNEAGDYSLVEGHAYQLMVNSSRNSKADIYPRLVSFVGETGSGKSTLIALLCKLFNPSSTHHFKTPIVGDSGSCQSTSSNVHLYADPQTYLSELPILYAECEGMYGDEIPAEMKTPLAGPSASSDPLPRASQIPELSSQDITWSKIRKHTGARTRKEITRIIFPRILYIFSHVVVFPFTSPTSRLDDSVLHLVRWGHRATMQSYNKPALPSCIIAFSDHDDQVNPYDFHLGTATTSFFKHFRDVSKDKTLQPYIQYWENHGQEIVSAKDLLSCYYSSVSVVILPSSQHPTRMHRQMEKLYRRIKEMCSESQERREAAWMKWNADTLPLFVRKALTHFASKYATPFDFSEAWVDLQNPSPNFTWSIFNLARMVRGHRDLSKAGMHLWSDIGGFIASCIFLNCVRTERFKRTASEEVLEQCDRATEQYWMTFWPCMCLIETPEGAQQCVNSPSGHPHHQGSNGIRGGHRDHLPSHSLETLQTEFRDFVRRDFFDLMSRLEQYSDSQERLLWASETHLIEARNFYMSIGCIGKLVSHLHCLVCLDGVPEHSLPCGHVICRECAKAIGDSTPGRFVTLQDCPLQNHDKEDWPRGLPKHDKSSKAGIETLSVNVNGCGPGKMSRGLWSWKRSA